MDAFDPIHDEYAELSDGDGPLRDEFMRTRLSPQLAPAVPAGLSPQGETTPAPALLDDTRAGVRRHTSQSSTSTE